MSDAILRAVLRRDRIVILGAVITLVALAWAYITWLAAGMDMLPAESGGMAGMNMSGSDGNGLLVPGIRPWSIADILFLFSMWAIMMIGMMLPSAAPMILIYSGVARQALARGRPFAATGWFAGGYVLAWTGFALLAAALQWALESALLLAPDMTISSHVLGGLVLIGVGLYQWTPLKENCLRQCQTPLAFIGRHGGFRREAVQVLALGALHGLYCIGCCWALMTLLFVGGVMNLFWIAGIAIFVMIEKMVPTGRWFSRSAGAILVTCGALLLANGS